jgi:hypothetical protein
VIKETMTSSRKKDFSSPPLAATLPQEIERNHRYPDFDRGDLLRLKLLYYFGQYADTVNTDKMSEGSIIFQQDNK